MLDVDVEHISVGFPLVDEAVHPIKMGHPFRRQRCREVLEHAPAANG